LQHVAVCCNVLQSLHGARPPVLLQCVAVCCSVAVCDSVLQ